LTVGIYRVAIAVIRATTRGGFAREKVGKVVLAVTRSGAVHMSFYSTGIHRDQIVVISAAVADEDLTGRRFATPVCTSRPTAGGAVYALVCLSVVGTARACGAIAVAYTTGIQIGTGGRPSGGSCCCCCCGGSCRSWRAGGTVSIANTAHVQVGAVGHG
jgi:hypothetical protein